MFFASAAEANLRIARHEIPAPFVLEEFREIVSFERKRRRSGGVAAGLGPTDQRAADGQRRGGGGRARVASVSPWL